MSNGWSDNLTFKPSSYLLNVNNNKVSRQNDYFNYADTSLFTGGISVNFWLYVSKDWFDNGIIDNVFLFIFNGKYFARIYTDAAGLVWLEVYGFKQNPGNGQFTKSSISVFLENFANRWHNICVTIPNGFYDNGDYGQIYYDGVLQHRNIQEGLGVVISVSGYNNGFCLGYQDSVPVDATAGSIDQYCDGDFIGYVFDLFAVKTELSQANVEAVYNCGNPWTDWSNPVFRANIVFWSRLQDRGSQNKKTTYILDDKSGAYKLKYISNFQNKFNVLARLPNSNLNSETGRHLAKTRNDNKFKILSVPNNDFQNLWIQNCAAEKTKYYDVQGLLAIYPAGTQNSAPIPDNTLKYLVGGGTFTEYLQAGDSSGKSIFINIDGLTTETGVLTGKLYFLLKITSNEENPPDLSGKSVLFVVDLCLTHTEELKRSVNYVDTDPNYLSGPITVPPLVHDINEFIISDVQHTGTNDGAILDVAIVLWNCNTNDENVGFEYSYLLVYSVSDTTAYIPLV